MTEPQDSTHNEYGVPREVRPGVKGYATDVRYEQCPAVDPLRGHCQRIGYPNEIADHVAGDDHVDVFGIHFTTDRPALPQRKASYVVKCQGCGCPLHSSTTTGVCSDTCAREAASS